jgi:hypothetical protein
MGQNNSPDELETIWEEAGTYIEKEDYNKAIETYKYILIRYGDNAIAAKYANAYIGDIYLTLKETKTTQTVLRKQLILTRRNLPAGTRWVSHIHCNVNGRGRLGNSKLPSPKTPITVNIFED